jgi:acetylornithine deacetylase
VLEETPGRPSVLVTARGSSDGRTLLLCGHLDTVNVEGMTDPHTARIEGDRLFGRGAYDMKSGVASALIACREAAKLGLAGDVVVAAVADEEHASLGVQEALRHVEADAAIVTEPTELALIVAHKGFVWAELEVTGRAAHGSRPDLGEDAIANAGPVLSGIAALDESLGALTHPLLGRGSVHASTIAGGIELSSYPDRCVIGVERRTLPDETLRDVEAELAALGAQHRILLVRDGFEVATNEDVVAATSAAAAALLGRTPPIAGVSYWADAAFIAAAGIPTVMFGAGGEGAHALEEWVSIPDTIAVTRILVEAARALTAPSRT